MSLSVSLYFWCIYHVRIQEKGQLPEFIVQLFDKESKNKPDQRKIKLSIINDLLEKQPNGQYQMNLQNNKIVEARSQIERTEAARNERGMPRTVCLANIFHGDEVLLKRAVDNGEVQVKADDGNEFYSFKSITMPHRKATEKAAQITEVSSGSIHVSCIREVPRVCTRA